MTTNQTIDGVRRDRLELCVKALASTGYTFESNELRALLDAKPIMCHGCMAEGVSPDHFDSTGKCKAAQPQGEHTAMEFLERMLKGSGDDRLAAWQGEMAMLLEHIAETKPQGEPVAFIQIPKNVEKYGHGNDPDRLRFGKPGQFFVDGKSPLFDFVLLYAEQPAPVAAVPDFRMIGTEKMAPMEYDEP